MHTISYTAIHPLYLQYVPNLQLPQPPTMYNRSMMIIPSKMVEANCLSLTGPHDCRQTHLQVSISCCCHCRHGCHYRFRCCCCYVCLRKITRERHLTISLPHSLPSSAVSGRINYVILLILESSSQGKYYHSVEAN